MSIKDHALIVSLSVGKPQMTKKDDTATEAAESTMGAHGAGKYQKDLYPKHLIKPIIAVESAARAWMKSNCYRWGENEYLLPSARFIKFAEGMANIEVQYSQAVTLFLQNWVNVLSEAQRTQGAMFNANEYPDVMELRRRFRFEVNYTPVADSNDFRVKLQEDELDMLRKQVEANISNRYEEMLRQPLERLRSTVARLRDTASKEERAVVNKRTGHTEIKPPIFRDTVVENVIEEIKLLEDFAAVIPADTLSLVDTLRESLPTADTLRASQEVRDLTVVNTSSLLGAIDALLED